LEYFFGSVKIMLIVGGLSAFISMLVAGVIRVLFAFIQRQRATAPAVAEAEGKPALRASGGEPGKAG